MKLKIILLSVCLMFSFEALSQVLAQVGSKKITVKEFKKKLNMVRQQSVNPPYPKQFLNDLIRYEAGVLQAKKEKVNQKKEFRDRMKQELYKVFVDQKLGKSLSNIRVSSSNMKSYYKNNPEVKTSHILFKTANFHPRNVARAKRKAMGVLTQIVEGKVSFSKAVKKYSDDDKTKENKGSLPYLGEASLVPEYYQAAKSLKNREVYYKPVRSQFGFHIIRLDGKRSYKEADKTQIRIALINKKRKKIFEKYFNRLMKKYNVSVNKKLLKNIR